METYINDHYISEEECTLCHETEDYTLAIQIGTKGEDAALATTIYICPDCLNHLDEQYFEMVENLDEEYSDDYGQVDDLDEPENN